MGRAFLCRDASRGLVLSGLVWCRVWPVSLTLGLRGLLQAS